MTDAIYKYDSDHPIRDAARTAAARAGNATRKADAARDSARKITAIGGAAAVGVGAAGGALAYRNRKRKANDQ